jgi:hypothetical protein
MHVLKEHALTALEYLAWPANLGGAEGRALLMHSHQARARPIQWRAPSRTQASAIGPCASCSGEQACPPSCIYPFSPVLQRSAAQLQALAGKAWLK